MNPLATVAYWGFYLCIYAEMNIYISVILLCIVGFILAMRKSPYEKTIDAITSTLFNIGLMTILPLTISAVIMHSYGVSP